MEGIYPTYITTYITCYITTCITTYITTYITCYITSPPGSCTVKYLCIVFASRNRYHPQPHAASNDSGAQRQRLRGALHRSRARGREIGK